MPTPGACTTTTARTIAGGLRQYPLGTAAHVDRFVGFFSAALVDAQKSRYDSAVPSFAALLAAG
jgi:hypothetical protein